MQSSDPASLEPILDPDLPIIDPHHHLQVMTETWLTQFEAMNTQFSRDLAPCLRQHRRYLLDELLADLNCGHNLRATVFLDSGAMYRADGPEEMKPVGEVEFANGVAAMSASGVFGTVRVCAGIVGRANLRLGDAVEEVLQAQIQAGGGRFRGVRYGAAYDPDPRVLGPGTPHLMRDAQYRAGARRLGKMGLSWDTVILSPQLPELADMAQAIPQVQIVLNHLGLPLVREGANAHEQFQQWRKDIVDLAKCENITIKLGGLGSTSLQRSRYFRATPRATSEQLAAEWRPYIETCIEAFGARRCMFESDFPPGSATSTYRTLWNAFKRLAAGASQDEKTALFSGTAARVYRLEN